MPKLLSDEEVFGASPPPPGSKALLSDADVFGPGDATAAASASTAAQAVRGLAGSYGQGSGELVSGVGQFMQAPAASTLSGLMGAGALADRGVTWLMRKAGIDAQLNPGIQRAAQDAAGYAMEQRRDNLTNGALAARLGAGLQQAGDAASAHWGSYVRENAPELISQGDEIQKAEGFTDTAGAMLSNPLGTAGMVARSVPSMVAGAGVAATAARTAGAVGRAVGAGDAVVARAAERAAESAGVVTEGLTSAMQTKQQVADFVKQQPLESLQVNSERFRELVASGMPPEQARERLAEELGAQSSVAAGAWTAGVNKATGAAAAMGRAVATGRSTGAEAIKGIAKEAVEEGIQNPGENFAQYAAQVQADPNQKFDLGGSVAQGLVTGAAMAAPMQGAAFVQNRLDQPGKEVSLEGQAPRPAEGTAALAQGQAAPAATGSDSAPAATAGAEAGLVSEAERALRAPSDLTALDRVAEIDAQAARLDERLTELDRPDAGYGEMFDAERADLAAQRQQLQQERAGLTKDWPTAVEGNATSFTTEAGARIDARYALMDASQLLTSHDEGLRKNPLYPQELQPRERDRAASEMQVAGIVQKIDPARLGLSAG